MINKVRKILNEKTAALISSPSSRRYISGFNASDGYIVITENAATFFADSRYFEAAKNKIKNMDVALYQGADSIKEYFKEKGITEIYIETAFLTVELLKAYRKAFGVKIKRCSALSNLLLSCRMVKSEEEIDSIKKAQEITDKAFSHILNFIKVGVTEREIALELEFFMRKLGSEGVAFDTIAVSGKNTSLPHGEPSEKKIENGDFITLDFGAVVNGYRSDMTRTVAVGNVSEKQKKVYNTVLLAQKKAMEKIRAGVKCAAVDKAARDIIDLEFKGAFGHALGHSVGLDIHESPNFSPKEKPVLKENMVLSVEPGIYLEGEFGVRIEDLIVVKKDGFINLTESPKDLIIL